MSTTTTATDIPIPQVPNLFPPIVHVSSSSSPYTLETRCYREWIAKMQDMIHEQKQDSRNPYLMFHMKRIEKDLDQWDHLEHHRQELNTIRIKNEESQDNGVKALISALSSTVIAIISTCYDANQLTVATLCGTLGPIIVAFYFLTKSACARVPKMQHINRQCLRRKAEEVDAQIREIAEILNTRWYGPEGHIPIGDKNYRDRYPHHSGSTPKNNVTTTSSSTTAATADIDREASSTAKVTLCRNVPRDRDSANDTNHEPSCFDYYTGMKLSAYSSPDPSSIQQTSTGTNVIYLQRMMQLQAQQQQLQQPLLPPPPPPPPQQQQQQQQQQPAPLPLQYQQPPLLPPRQQLQPQQQQPHDVLEEKREQLDASKLEEFKEISQQDPITSSVIIPLI